MLAELPGFYENVLEMRVLAEAEGLQFDQFWDAAEDSFRQQFVSTATWGLANWEAELGIVPPAGQPIEQRRAVVRSKMRGYGKFTGRLLKSVAEAYDGGAVDVGYTPVTGEFSVTFIDTRGIPPNLEDLKAAIEEILPAHLTVEYVFIYLDFGELNTSGTTFGDLDTSGMTFADLETWNS